MLKIFAVIQLPKSYIYRPNDCIIISNVIIVIIFKKYVEIRWYDIKKSKINSWLFCWVVQTYQCRFSCSTQHLCSLAKICFQINTITTIIQNMLQIINPNILFTLLMSLSKNIHIKNNNISNSSTFIITN